MFLGRDAKGVKAFPVVGGINDPGPLRTLAIPGTIDPGHHTQSSLREGKIRFNPFYVRGMDDGRFCQMPFAFGILGRHKMAAGRMRAQHLARSSNLEPFGDGFSRFAARDWLRHKARKISTSPGTDNRFSVYRLV